MFTNDIIKRIHLLDPNSVEISQTEMHLVETKEGGEADIQLQLSCPSIMFKKLETKKLQYFINQKCADYVVFEQTESGWHLHIFELKRTVTIKSWESIKKQFEGAYENALALTGFLNIDLIGVTVHSCYRNDKINNYNSTVGERIKFMRWADNSNIESVSDWNEEKVRLKFIDEQECVHQKIKLGLDDGVGLFEM